MATGRQQDGDSTNCRRFVKGGDAASQSRSDGITQSWRKEQLDKIMMDTWFRYDHFRGSISVCICYGLHLKYTVGLGDRG